MVTTQPEKHGKLITKDAVAEKVPKTGPWAHMSCHRAYKGCGKLFRASLKQATTAKEVKSPCCNVMIPVHPLEPEEVTDPTPQMPIVLPAPAGDVTQAMQVHNHMHLPPGTTAPTGPQPTLLAPKLDQDPRGEDEPEPAVGAGAPNDQLEIVETFGSPDSPTVEESVGISDDELRADLRHGRVQRQKVAEANADAEAARIRAAAPPPPKKDFHAKPILKGIGVVGIACFVVIAGVWAWNSVPEKSSTANVANADDQDNSAPQAPVIVNVQPAVTITQAPVPTQTPAPTPTPSPTSSQTTSSSPPPKPECPTEANGGITGVGSRTIQAKVMKDCSTVVNTGVADSVQWSFTALDNSKLPDCVLVEFSNGWQTNANAGNQLNGTFGPQEGNPLELTFGSGCSSELWVLIRN